MHIEELDYSYPQTLVAKEPVAQSRVLVNEDGKCRETSPEALLNLIQEGDVLVINDSKVLARRVFSQEGLEILFMNQPAKNFWEVLCPASRIKDDKPIILPEGVKARLTNRGLPQLLAVSQELNEDYFENHGELPLPPYIQKARGSRHNKNADKSWYQTAWAKRPGSFAAPTASFHFSLRDLKKLKTKGVTIVTLTLHVGMGSFLPIRSKNLEQHKMHGEWVDIPISSWEIIEKCQIRGQSVWALGTTVTRALESCARSKLTKDAVSYKGWTELFIYPGFEFKVVDVLMTNFHQPRTSLLALVSAFAGIEKTKSAYHWAIENKFRLFSYGDLTVWL